MDCNNLVFGDPANGVVKSCYIGGLSLLSQGAPDGYTFCATEGNKCSFQGIASIALGKNDKFVYTQHINDLECQLSNFPSDPIPGEVKACYIKTIAPAGYTFCSLENQSCNFSGTQKVAYGAKDKYVYLDQTDGSACNNIVFGDPVSGTFKACFLPSSLAASGTSSGNTNNNISDTDDTFDDLIPASEITAAIDGDVTPPIALVGAEVGFSGAGSVGNTLAYHWDFGDGSSEDADPERTGDTTHLYDKSGLYNVTLSIYDKETGATKTSNYKISILPDIQDMVSSRIVERGGSVNFNASPPIDGLKYEWSFSDGTTSNGPIVNHTFTKIGLNDVRLTIYDERSHNQQTTDGQPPILLEKSSFIKVSLGNLDAEFRENTMISNLNYPYTFLNANTAGIKSTYDFGDGTTSNDLNPEHYYSNPGIYTVIHTIEDIYGNILSSKNIAEVSAIRNHTAETYNPYIMPDLHNRFTYTPDKLYAAEVIDQSYGHEPMFTSNEYYPIDISSTLNTGNAGIFKKIYQDGQNSSGELVHYINTLSTQFDENYYNKFTPGETVQTIIGELKPIAVGHFGIGANSAPIEMDILHLYTYHSLLIPRIIVNVLPDYMTSTAEPTIYKMIVNGRPSIVAQYNIPESEYSQSGMLKAKVPIYTLDDSGNVIESLNGKISLEFLGNETDINDTSIKEVSVIHGKAEIPVLIPFGLLNGSNNLTFANILNVNCTDNYKLLTSDGIPFNNITPLEAQNLSRRYSTSNLTSQSISTPNGFKPLTVILNPPPLPPPVNCYLSKTTYDAPSNLLTIDPNVIDYSEVALNAHFTPQSLTGLRKAWNTLILGATPEQRKAINERLDKYESGFTGNTVAFVPFVGDGVALIIQGIHKANGQPEDKVVIILSSIGLAVDTSNFIDAGASLPAGATVDALNVTYRATKHFPVMRQTITDLLSQIKPGMTPLDSINILRSSSGFLVDAIKTRTLPQNFIAELEDSVKLIKGNSGALLESLQKMNKSYSEMKDAGLFTMKFNGKSISYAQRLKLAKYHVISPELAKNMAHCGTSCIKLVDNFAKSLEKQGINKVDRLREVESDLNAIKNRNIQNGYKQTEKEEVEEVLWKGACKVPNSFDAATLIRTSTGLRPINSLLIGDQVLAYNEATAANGYYPITATMQHLDTQATTLRLQGANGSLETINTTPEHPFYVTQEVDGSKRPSPVGHEELNSHWVGAGHLVVGDKLKLADGHEGKVLNVTTFQKTQQMFNLTVDTAHTFYVGNNGWLVHNCGLSYEEAIKALTDMRGQGGHAIRKLISDGFIPNTGSPESKTQFFIDNIALPILQKPDATAFYKVGNTPSAVYIGKYQNKDIAIFISQGETWTGKVIAAFQPSSTQRTLWGLP